MCDLSKVGLKLVGDASGHAHLKESTAVYLDGFRVAWFQNMSRESDGVTINTVSGDIVHRPELSALQVEALRKWLRSKLLAAI